MVDIFAGDILRLHLAEEFAAVVLVKFHEHVGSLVAVEEAVEVFCIVKLQVVVQLCDVGRVEVGENGAGFLVVAVGDYLFYVVEIFLVEFFHRRMCLIAWKPAGWSIR